MFDAYVRFQAKVRPEALAIITSERWVTYGQLEADVNRLAAGLAALGLTPACGVTAVSITQPYLKHVAVLALARLGVVSSPGDDPAPNLRLVRSDGPARPGELALSGDWLAAAWQAEPRPLPTPRVDQDAIVRVMLSSGTTRTARRVARTWRMLEGNTRTAALTYLAGKPGRWVCMTGLDTGLGQAMTLGAWAEGACIVPGFAVEQLAAELPRLSPSIIGLTPNHLRRLLALIPANLGVQPGLRLVMTGGVLPPAIALAARTRLSSDIVITYGATETGSISMGDGAWLEQAAGVAGYAVPGIEIDVVDADGAPLPPGEQGEVRIVSDRAAQGYMDDPEANARAFRDGAFYTGDLGRLMPDGLLFIDGRLDDRMDLGGMKFMPDRLEEVALGCPGVIDAAAYAAPDAQGMDACWLAVVAGADFDRQRLADLIAGRRDMPRVNFAWIDEIPRNAMGKAERRRLRDDTLAALEGAGSA